MITECFKKYNSNKNKLSNNYYINSEEKILRCISVLSVVHN